MKLAEKPQSHPTQLNGFYNCLNSISLPDQTSYTDDLYWRNVFVLPGFCIQTTVWKTEIISSSPVPGTWPHRTPQIGADLLQEMTTRQDRLTPLGAMLCPGTCAKRWLLGKQALRTGASSLGFNCLGELLPLPPPLPLGRHKLFSMGVWESLLLH